jgi:hypothetical protein
MLTPAEELGLSGLNLESRIRKAFYGLSADAMIRLADRMTAEAFRRSLIYTRQGDV